MNTIYKNNFGASVTAQQTILLDKYFIHFLENGVIKEIHRVDKNYEKVPLHINYYINENEDVTTVRNQLIEKTNSFSIVFTSTYQDCQIHEYKNYFNGEYSDSHKILYRDDLEICWQPCLFSGEPDLENTEKYYYDSSGNQKLCFFYSIDGGNISSVAGKPPFEPYDNHIDALSYNEFIFYNPVFLTENPYYIDATFLPE